MIPLYKITDQFRNALKEMGEADIPIDAIQDTLEGIQGEFEDKASNVAAYVKNLQAEVIAVDSYIDNMTKRKKSLESKIEHFQDYLHNNMKKCQLTKIIGDELSIRIKKTQGKVVIEEGVKIPVQYMRSIPKSSAPDKAAIKDALKAGKKVRGCTLQTNTRLEIK